MAKTATAIDVGSFAVRVLQGRDAKGVFSITAFHEEPRGTLSAQEALDEALAGARLKSAPARIGVTGSDTMFRYLQIPDSGDAQVRKFVEFEIAELSGQSDGGIVGGFNLLHPPSLSDDLTVGIALTKASRLEAVAQQLKATQVRAKAFTPNAVALFNAYLKTEPGDEGTVLLACIGEENTDVAIANGTDLYFARNLSGGARFFVQAIRDGFRLRRPKALELLHTVADLDPARKGKLPSPAHEKVSQALMSSAGQLSSLLQSSVMFARSQAKISELDVKRVLICGGGARIKGLCAYLTSAMGKPVDLFDPWDDIDLSALPEDEHEALSKRRLESVVALGLALGECYRDFYQLEIVPPSLERRRNLLQRTSFLVGAGVLALAYLIVDYDRSANAEEVYAKGSSEARRKGERILATDESGTAGLEDYTGTWHRSARLVPWLLSGPTVLAALEGVTTSLPADFSIIGSQGFREPQSSEKGYTGPRPLGRPFMLVAVEHLQRGGDLAKMRREFLDRLFAPGRFNAQQCKVLDSREVPSAFKFKAERGATVMVLKIDPFAPVREEKTQDEEPEDF